MKLKLWQVDAFAQRRFQGNPAAVVPLEEWLSDATLQAIAAENNLSETAFLVARAPGNFDLRWFTPTIEVPLCGHATLASGWVVLNEFSPESDVVRFQTKSGELTVRREGDGGPYDFVSRFFVPGKGVPEDPVTGSAHASLTPFWAKRLGKRTLRAYQASARGGDLLCSEEGERVTLSGRCALYLKGEIEI